jgi:mRNA-degrading endonuclease RelE of RelBE toxin-antitoxin system
MTCTVVWRNKARQALSRLRGGDLASAELLTAAVRALADDPYPGASNQLGGSRFWRLRLGELRVAYEVDGTASAIYIYSIGRMRPAT